MSFPFDATLKDIVQQCPADYAVAFGLPSHLPAAALNVDLSTITAATDVAFGFGDPVSEIADLNFQSGPDDAVEARIHLYSAAYNHRYRVPIRSLLILLRPAADHSRLSGKYRFAVGASRVEFDYEAVRMWQQPLEPFLHGGLGLLPLAPLCQMPLDVPLNDALKQAVHEIDNRLAAEAPNAVAVRLMTAAFILTGMRVNRAELDDIYRGVRVMHESSAFDLVEYRAKVGELHRMLLRLGRRNLGAADSSTESALSAIQDLDRLERMLEAIQESASWSELLSTP